MLFRSESIRADVAVPADLAKGRTRATARAAARACLAWLVKRGSGVARGFRFVLEGRMESTSAGTRVHYAQQWYRRLPIHGAWARVELPARSRRARLEARLFASTPLAVAPRITAVQAARSALSHLRVYPARLTRASRTRDGRTVFRAGLRTLTARLELLPASERLVLCWRVRSSHRRRPEHYEVRVDASRSGPPRILQTTDRLRSVHAASVRLPGLGMQAVSLPEPANRFPLAANSLAPPAVWVDQGKTDGPNVEIDPQNGPKTLAATASTTGPDIFQAPDADRERLLTVFYFTNYAHDFYYRLGFDPAHGSFDSAGKVDRLFVRVWGDAIDGDATMETPTDGEAPRMDLGPTPGGHTALDPEIILHEYTHGVVARRVGGRGDDSSLEAPQSLAMAEGWCDFFTLSLFSALTGTARRRLGTEAYGAGGLRDYATVNTNFGSIGQGTFAAGTGALYRIGQIWCATLLDLERRLVAVQGPAVGRELCWVLILDSLLLLRRNPNFLQGRDALLKAVADKGLPPAVLAETWSAFAALGMGPAASCVGTSFEPTVPDFNTP